MPTLSRTSLKAIVAAGRSIIEADGLDGLTMQSVADAVGVRAPSLYKHVSNRGQLIRLIAEDVAGELAETLDAAAVTDDPQCDLRALADAFRTFAHARPAAYGLLFAPLPDAWRPGSDRLAAASAAVLRTSAALAGEARALEAARTVVAWAHGFISMELAGAFRLGGEVESAYSFGMDRLGAALAQTTR
jgi:AcrR family transcriptional regulator